MPIGVGQSRSCRRRGQPGRLHLARSLEQRLGRPCDACSRRTRSHRCRRQHRRGNSRRGGSRRAMRLLAPFNDGFRKYSPREARWLKDQRTPSARALVLPRRNNRNAPGSCGLPACEPRRTAGRRRPPWQIEAAGRHRIPIRILCFFDAPHGRARCCQTDCSLHRDGARQGCYTAAGTRSSPRRKSWGQRRIRLLQGWLRPHAADGSHFRELGFPQDGKALFTSARMSHMGLCHKSLLKLCSSPQRLWS